MTQFDDWAPTIQPHLSGWNDLCQSPELTVQTIHEPWPNRRASSVHYVGVSVSLNQRTYVVKLDTRHQFEMILYPTLTDLAHTYESSTGKN